MRCPYCGSSNDRVVDSRAAEAGAAIRRRRHCDSCDQRFSTYERVEQVLLSVGKRDGSVEPYSRAKVLAGFAKATANLDVGADAASRAAARVEARLRGLGQRTVASGVVGEEVLRALRGLDPVAYMRFASVYKGFTSPDDFRRELATLDADGRSP